MVKKLVSIVLILSSLSLLIIDYSNKSYAQEKIDSIISKKEKTKYDGYIYIPKLNYKNVISTKNVLDDNKIYMISDKSIIKKEYGNIILAGHNNKYVFSNIYKLDIGDEIILNDFTNNYIFKVYEVKYINVKDKTVLDNAYNEKIITLITCTNNNQTRYVVRAYHIISHN